MSKWVAGVLASIIAAVLAGVILLWLDLGDDDRSPYIPPTITPTQSLLERVSGEYEFVRWQLTNTSDRPRMIPTEGSLRIDENGQAIWELQLQHNGSLTAEEGGALISIVSSGGTVVISSEQIAVGHSQSSWPNGFPKELTARDPETGKEFVAFMKSLDRAFGSEDEGFSFSLDEGSNETILQWRNSMGVLNWRKTGE